MIKMRYGYYRFGNLQYTTIVHVGYLSCMNCGFLLRDYAVVYNVWRSRADMEIVELCQNCAADERHRPVVGPKARTSFFICAIHEEIPAGAVPHIFVCPEFSDGKISSFDAARSNRGIDSEAFGARVIDRTRLSGRPEATLEGARVGADVHDLLEHKDAALMEREALEFLEELGSMEVVEYDAKKLLEERDKNE